jgi:spore germination cell wall hydrolase CwlJ-like protein|tara:strand:- start:355 stop:900 length:546 start_codon:yes stop_codon:yes gene_type:complete
MIKYEAKRLSNERKSFWKVFVLVNIILACLCFSEAVFGKEYIHSCEYSDRQTELTSLACNVYFEARGESRAGKIAVALVTLNRVQSNRFPDDITNVVYQKYQFSWHSDGLSDKVKDLKAWNNAIHIASYVLGIDDKEYPYVDITDGSLFYHSVKVNPLWANEGNIIVRIDNHLFYKEDLKK